MRPGDMTPWGPAQDVQDHGQGVFSVYTAGHGGIFVPRELLARIPARERAYAEKWSGSPQWFEEDCAAAIPVFRLPELFPTMDEGRRAAWFESVKGYWEN